MNAGRVAIRVDASTRRGTGHVMRCLTLAEELRRLDVRVDFLSRRLAGHLCDEIAARGFTVHIVDGEEEPASPETALASWPADASGTLAALSRIEPDWLVVDHYGLDERWESSVRVACGRLMVIDDMANRPHDCNLLLDQNYYENMSDRYDALIPADSHRLLGPRYALLRPEFAEARLHLRVRDGRIGRVFCFFGGADPGNETEKFIAAYAATGWKDVTLDVVVGAGNPHRTRIEAVCAALPNARFHCQIRHMAELMTNADLGVGAGGTATWERCCVGLPALVTILADNQFELTVQTARYGALINLGWADRLTADDYRHALAELTPERLRSVSDRALSLTDGQGCRQVAEALLN